MVSKMEVLSWKVSILTYRYMKRGDHLTHYLLHLRKGKRGMVRITVKQSESP